MPNRIIRESCQTSDTLLALSDGAERMFWRMTTACDDWGRFEADPRVVKSKTFPKWQDDHIPEIRAWLQEWAMVGLARYYEVGGRSYGYFPSWFRHQTRRKVSRPKFPDPPDGESGNARTPLAELESQPPSVNFYTRSRGVEESRSRGVEESTVSHDTRSVEQAQTEQTAAVAELAASTAAALTPPAEPVRRTRSRQEALDDFARHLGVDTPALLANGATIGGSVPRASRSPPAPSA